MLVRGRRRRVPGPRRPQGGAPRDHAHLRRLRARPRAPTRRAAQVPGGARLGARRRRVPLVGRGGRAQADLSRPGAGWCWVRPVANATGSVFFKTVSTLPTRRILRVRLSMGRRIKIPTVVTRSKLPVVYEPEAGHWARLNRLCWDLTILRAHSRTRTSRQSRFVARCTMLLALHHKPPGVQFLNKRFLTRDFVSKVKSTLISPLSFGAKFKTWHWQAKIPP